MTDSFIDVPRMICQNQVDDFVSDGFLVMPDLINPQELEELKTDMLKLARGGYPSKTFKSLPEDTPDQQVLENILCIHFPHYISDIMLKYVKHKKICGVLSQVTAAHLPAWDGSVKCMQSMLFVKPPGFQGQSWHQDEIYIPTRDRSLIGAWIAIDDATVDNGCLWVIPGSHSNGYMYPQRENTDFDEYDISQVSYGFDTDKAIPVEVKAGSVVFFNGYTLHKSLRNHSDIYRRALVSHYMNAYSMLPWHIDEDSRFGNADDRRVVHVAGTDPYAWKGYLEAKEDVFLRQCKAAGTAEVEQAAAK